MDEKTERIARFLNLRREGLEPSSLAACAPQTHAYTNSATCAKTQIVLRGNNIHSTKKQRLAQRLFPSFVRGGRGHFYII